VKTLEKLHGKYKEKTSYDPTSILAERLTDRKHLEEMSINRGVAVTPP
jgi:hypothetical protein